ESVTSGEEDLALLQVGDAQLDFDGGNVGEILVGLSRFPVGLGDKDKLRVLHGHRLRFPYPNRLVEGLHEVVHEVLKSPLALIAVFNLRRQRLGGGAAHQELRPKQQRSKDAGQQLAHEKPPSQEEGSHGCGLSARFMKSNTRRW